MFQGVAVLLNGGTIIVASIVSGCCLQCSRELPVMFQCVPVLSQGGTIIVACIVSECCL